MKVVTFNLRCANDPNGNAIAERAPRVKVLMDQYDADLVGFQEVTPAWMEHLTADYGDQYEIFNQYRAKSNLESTPMMWKKDRFDCLDKGYFWLSDTPDVESKGWDSLGCHRICMWASLRDKKTGVRFTFFNTHYGFGDPCQIASGELIINHIKAMGVKSAILTADFNMSPINLGYRKLQEAFVDVNAETAKDTRTTFHGYSTEARDAQIDFCFVTPNTVIPLKSKRMDELVDGKFPSDHYGVYSEVEVRETVSLITFNVCVAKPTEERGQAMRRTLRKYGADIIALQEVSPLWMEALKGLEGYDSVCHYRAEKDLEATPIFWKRKVFRLVEEQHFWLSETPDQESKGFGGQFYRICSMVVLEHIPTGKKICHFNTHFDFSAEAHVASAKLLQERAKSFADLPVICTGDYNMLIGGAGYRAMREAFHDFRWEVAKTDCTPTVNGWGADMVGPVIIDYVFASKNGIAPLSYHVIDEQYQGIQPSDHNGILVSFTLENKE